MDSTVKPAIVFLVPHAPAMDFPRKFFVQEFTSAGLEVHYWNVGPLMNYNVAFRSSTEGLQYEQISGFGELRRRVREMRARAVFVPQITRNMDSYLVYLLVHLLDVKTAFFARGYLPHISESRSVGQSLRTLFSGKGMPAISRARIMNIIFRFLPRPVEYDVTFTAGEIAERLHKAETRKTVPVHHPDLDLIFSQKKKPKQENKLVFLDDYLTDHPDFRLTGAATIGAEEYHKSLCDFFNRVEQAFDSEVVIAAHPKADYLSDTFGGRRVVFDGTVDLVRNTRLVLAHFSTAISFAVVYGKPMFLLTSTAIERTYPSQSQQLQATAALLGSPVYRLDAGDAQSMVEPQVSAEKYQAFRTTFLSDAPEARYSAEIVVEEVLQLLSSSP